LIRRGEVTKVSQLRMYRIAEGKLAEFVQQWMAGVLPLRRKMGFTVDGAWTVRGEDRFVWIVSYEGEESFEAKNAEYYESPERKALDPNPADLIEESVALIISPVWSA
jgi:NIPSNAP